MYKNQFFSSSILDSWNQL